MKEFANIRDGPFICEIYLAKPFLVNNTIDNETVTAATYPLAMSVPVYLLEAFLFP